MLELIANTILITKRPSFEHNTETNKYSMKRTQAIQISELLDLFITLKKQNNPNE